MKVLVCYRNPGSYSEGYTSHGGLCNNAMWTVKMLRSIRVVCLPMQVWTLKDLTAAIAKNPDTTHCVIEAQFLSVAELTQLTGSFPEIAFVQRNHSQVPFLATCPNDITLLRAYLYLQDGIHNLQVSCNSRRFCEWIEGAYRQKCLYLPNAYVIDRPGESYNPPKISNDTLRIGCYGAIRLLKNQATGAAAALLAARQLNKKLEFHMNDGRTEKGTGVAQGIRNFFAGLNWAKLVFDPWSDYPHFRQLVSTMDACVQLSSTETFNLVTADACAEGVASVVGDAIQWAPAEWRASIDDPVNAARVLVSLLTNPLAICAGQARLAHYCKASLEAWKAWLGIA